MKIWDFPTSLPILSEVFYASGAAFDGGLTTGSAWFLSPEPGGRAALEREMSLQTNEFTSPFISWLMSKINGEVFRVKLTNTPQLISNSLLGTTATIPWEQEGQYPVRAWDNGQFWANEPVIISTSVSLQGSTTLIVNTSLIGDILKVGHVIGHLDCSYMIDEIDYDNHVATVVVKPPLRNKVNTNDLILLRPYFLGTIMNGGEIVTSYQASNVGYIQPSKIKFSEVIL